MHSYLKNLIKLQELDLKIAGLEQEIKKIPAKIETLDHDSEKHGSAVDELHEKIKDNNKLRRQSEGDVDALREKLSKYKSQLMEVKTNREYQAMLHEIEETKQKIEKKEDLTLVQMLALEELQERAIETEGVLVEHKNKATKQGNLLKIFSSQAQQKIEGYKKKRELLVTKIPEELNQRYERISLVRNGISLSEAKDQSCQACHVKLRPQLFNDIKTNQQIITCDSCNRILYYSGA